jgi:large exoprotein involved in heme utilization and adhesion
LQVLTDGRGNAGTLKIQATDTVSFDGVGSDGMGKQFSSSAFSTVEEEGQGNGGSIDITTRSLTVRNGAGLAASTRGKGDAGNVTIRASDTVSFDGQGANGFYSNATSRVEEKAFGNGGSIDITTKLLTLRNGALLQTSTVGTGSAGNVTIRASDTVSFDGKSAAMSTVEKAGATGNGGNIDITTKSLFLTDGSQLQVLTRGQGSAGTVTIRATDTVSFDGVNSNGYPSAAASTVEAGAVGNGGGINVTTGSLSVTNGALLSSSSQGNGAAGNIEVAAHSIKLDNLANLTAETAIGKGGNITLQDLDLLLMRRGSQISTTAGTARQPGDGGNIIINAPNGFIVAVPRENSNITANAFSGSGGRIQINATNIFGLTVLSREDLVRVFGNDLTNIDFQRLPSSITAISQTSPNLNGQVNLNTPDIDINRGLVALPAEVVDATGLIDQNFCAATSGRSSSFTITGRGGLPPSPNSALNSDKVWEDWRLTTVPSGDVEQQATRRSANATRAFQPTITPKRATPKPIVEATGWVKNELGEVFLTANPPTVTPHNSWLNPLSCH